MPLADRLNYFRLLSLNPLRLNAAIKLESCQWHLIWTIIPGIIPAILILAIVRINYLGYFITLHSSTINATIQTHELFGISSFGKRQDELSAV
ncbi:MAG: hypothetical protein EHM14_03955 [Methanothrix sp.]|nr:MAG: hypothetical protein EHM14_03955 [Methanothrix sp.]